MGCSPSTSIEAEVLSKSILRKLVVNPEDWNDFLEIFVVESFSLLNKNVTVAEKAFIVVVSGEVTAFLSSRGAGSQPVPAKVYRSPDLIHVVRTKSAAGGENENGDRGNMLSYGDLSISFKATASEGNVSVVSFDLADVEEFVGKRPHLVMLSKLLKLQYCEVLGGNLEFSSWSSDEINMLLPLTQLRLTSLGDVLSRTVEKSAAADSVESGTVYAENQLKADCSAGILIEGTFILIDDDSSAEDFWEKYRKAVMAKKQPPSRAKRNSLWSATPLLSAIPDSKRDNKVYADADVHYDFKDQGILLELGSTYGLEQILLKDPIALDTIVCCDDGLVATLSPQVISACKVVAQGVVKRLHKIFNSAVIESVMECVPLFNSLNARDLDRLESEVEIVTLPAGSTLHKHDDPSTHIYVVVRGCLEELIYSKQDVSNDMSFNIGEIHETGACLGELSVISEAPYSNTLTCIVPCVIIAINAATYKAVFRNVDQNQCEEKIRESGTAVAMEYVLMHSDAYKSFCGFLKIEMSAENIQFWHAVAQFEELCTVMSGLDRSAKNGESRSESPSYSPLKVRRGSVQSSSIQKMSSAISRDSTIRMQANTMSKLKDMAGLIMTQYVSEGAAEQVNIPGPMRKETEASYKAWLESLGGSDEFDPLTIFAKAKREVFALMKKDSFPRWKDTPEFLQLVEKLRQTSSGDVKHAPQSKRRKTTKK